MKNLLKNVSFKAVSIGFLVDFIGTTIFALLYSIIVASFLVAQGHQLDEINRMLHDSILLNLIPLFIGVFFAVLGGFLAGIIAESDKMKNASVIGIISLFLTTISFIVFKTTEPLWYNMISFLLPVPSALLGGFLALKVSKSKMSK